MLPNWLLISLLSSSFTDRTSMRFWIHLIRSASLVNISSKAISDNICNQKLSMKFSIGKFFYWLKALNFCSLFFSSKLKSSAHPVEEADNPFCLVSAGDCWSMTFETVSEATRLWIKGGGFSVARLLGDAADAWEIQWRCPCHLPSCASGLSLFPFFRRREDKPDDVYFWRVLHCKCMFFF